MPVSSRDLRSLRIQSHPPPPSWLKLLEEAGLIVTRREGREKLHFLNAVPIRLIHDRWIDKYKERELSALADLKSTLEKTKCPPLRKRA